MADETPTTTRGPIAWMASNPVAANLLMLIILVGGIVGMLTIKQEVFPDFDLDTVTVSVPYPGATPEEVEQGIVLAVEEAVRGIDGVKRVTGTATEGLAVVSMELELSADPDTVLDDTKAAVDRIQTLPGEAEEPRVEQLSGDSLVASVVLAGDLDLTELALLAEDLEDRLLGSDGVTSVAIEGVPDRELRIEVPSAQLQAHGLTLDEVSRQVGLSSLQLSGGEVTTDARSLLVQVSDRRLTADGIRSIPLRTPAGGGSVRLGDIATVVDGFEETDRATYFDGQRAVRVNVYRVADETPAGVAAVAHGIVDELRSELPGTVDLVVWTDDSRVLQERIDLLVENALLGLVLVVLILALFLNLRLAFWVSLGIPISFLGAFALMPTSDVSINMISLFAFIITLGTVVDDAIVIGENVFAKLEEGLPPLTAAIEGSREMAAPVTFAVLTSMAAFAPMLAVPGTFGKIFAIFPVIVGLVLLFSLIESFFVLPAHLAHGGGRDRTPAVVRRVQGAVASGLQWGIDHAYEPLLRRLLGERMLTFSAAVAMLVLSVGLVGGEIVPFQFFPDIDGEVVRVDVRLPSGSPPQATEEVRVAVEAAAQEAIDGMESAGVVGMFTRMGQLAPTPGPAGGRPEVASNLMTVELALGPGSQRDLSAHDFVQAWEAATPELAQVQSMVFSVPGAPKAGSDIELQLSHPDRETLIGHADALYAQLGTYPSLTNLETTTLAGKPQIDLELNDVGRALGLHTQDLARQLRGSIHGVEALREQRGRNEVTVVARLPASERSTLHDLEQVPIRTGPRGYVPIDHVAELTATRAPTRIVREDGRRIETVSADLSGIASSSDVVKALNTDVLGPVKAGDPDLRVAFAGAEREASDSLAALGFGYAITLFVVYALLAIPFKSYTQPFIVMMAIPFGLVGAVLGHLLLGFQLSLISLFGLIALSGVVVNDSLVLVHATNALRRDGVPVLEAVVQAGKRRFRPILLTTLTTFFGLVPMILETSMQARFLIPMAISLGFGILFATGIILLLVPLLYVTVEDVGAAVVGTPRRIGFPPSAGETLTMDRIAAGGGATRDARNVQL